MRETDPQQVEQILGELDRSTYGDSSLHARARLLERLARALESSRESLVELAGEETHLPAARLNGELSRTVFQLRHWARQLAEGETLRPVVDPEDLGHPLGSKPGLIRVDQAVGPVLVFAASNFPFAFSVLGGDTASALAAGCPVVVKAHPGHPRLSDRVAELAASCQAPVHLVHGETAARAVLLDRRIKAAAFTGSTEGGTALHRLAASRDEPIPFFGELGGLNPVFVSPRAVRARGPEISAGFVASFTQGVGQFCTKPGLLLLPVGHGLENLLINATAQVAAAPMLGDWIERRYSDVLALMGRRPGVRTLHAGCGSEPTLLGTQLSRLVQDPVLLQECFGPTSLVVEYEQDSELLAFARDMPGTLTATVHAEEADGAWAGPLVGLLARKAGRLVWNGWPTGVAVSEAMVHGGPWPAATAPGYSSVGGNAMTRFLRPVCFQNLPVALIPDRHIENSALTSTGHLTHEDH